jgi:predicted branched-subunit amino acid permease
MIASLYMGGYAPLALSMSVVLVNARQLLYSSALLVRFEGVGRGRATLAASNITDETFGVNMAEYEKGGWGAGACFGTNCLAQATWTAANVAGAAIGALVPIEAGLAAFAMTSVFTCLLLMQGRQPGNLAAVCGTAAALVACKLAGLDRIAVFLAACVGIACGFVAGRRDGDNEQGSDNVRGDDTDALA